MTEDLKVTLNKIANGVAMPVLVIQQAALDAKREIERLEKLTEDDELSWHQRQERPAPDGWEWCEHEFENEPAQMRRITGKLTLFIERCGESVFRSWCFAQHHRPQREDHLTFRAALDWCRVREARHA